MFAIQCCLFLFNKKSTFSLKPCFIMQPKIITTAGWGGGGKRAYSYERPYFRWFSKFESGILVCVSYPCCSVLALVHRLLGRNHTCISPGLHLIA